MISSRSSLAILIAFGLATAAAQQPAIPRPDGSSLAPSQIDGTVTELMASAHVTGVGLAVFHDGKVAYLHAYGLRDTEKSLPLTPDSIMTSASLSKAAFATVVMKLVEQGVLDIDKPVYEYLPK